MIRIKNCFRWLTEMSQIQVKNFGAQYDAFSVFIFIFYLANPLRWHFGGPYSFSTVFFLRAFAVIIWLTLVLWRCWPKRSKQYLPLFWHFALLYHLPFRTTFSILHSSNSPSFDSFGLLGIVALAALVNDKVFCVLTLVGVALGSVVYFVFGGLNVPPVTAPNLIYAGLMTLAIAFTKLIFFRNHNSGLHEKSSAFKTLAGAIAHEVRGPLSTLSIAAENLNSVSTSRRQEYLDIIKHQARKSLNIIDSILLQVKYIENSDCTECSMQSLNDCISTAVNDAYFSDLDREQIRIVDEKDYSVLVDKLLLVQVLSNLIKNSLWAIRAKGGGEIIISVLPKKDTVSLVIFDNGIGMSAKDQKRLFAPFFSKTRDGIGLGLAFCKLAVKNMGGSITCESQEKDFTRFTISLRSDEKLSA